MRIPPDEKLHRVTIRNLVPAPFRAWNGQARGAVNLHGHSHGRGKPLPRQVDVGVDAWDFRPIGFETISERIGPKPESMGGERTLT